MNKKFQNAKIFFLRRGEYKHKILETKTLSLRRGWAVARVRSKLLYIINFIFVLTIISCGDSGSGTNNRDKSFPSPGSPSGNDAISSSTNRSSKENETTPKLNALAGAGFVQVPEINNYGTVNLSYPIDVPGGRAGLQPGISLLYSSSGSDGLSGIGWSLGTGTGVISRRTGHGQLFYDYRDTFTYNGKRLIKVSGPQGSENGTYRLEIESEFSRFELSNAGSGGVWRVYDRAGTVTIFGEKINQRIYQPQNINKTYIWNFTRMYDLNGNYMEAVYETAHYNTNHILYLKEIKYTGNYNENESPRQYVRFHYMDRPDSYFSKAPGFIMKMDKLLDRIEVGWDDNELWSYNLIYEMSEDSNRPLLRTVESTRTSTQPEFIYRDASHLFVWQKVNNPNYNDPENNHESTKYFEGDFNGDGISDMVFFNPETGNWRAAEGRRNGGYNFVNYGNRYRGYDNESKIQWFKGNVTGDYNGDGRSDIAFYLPGTGEFWVAEHNGLVFEFKRYGTQNLTDVDIFKCEWFTGDFDGNGLSDAVLFNEPTGEWLLMRNMGGYFNFFKLSQHFQNLFRDDYISETGDDPNHRFFSSDNSEYGKDRGKVHFLSGDYNGDGRTDISIYDARTGSWWVGENNRTPLNPPSRGEASEVEFRLEWKLYKIFTVPEMALFGFDRFSGDFNGDGFSDFLLFDRGNGEWILGETHDSTINFRVFSKLPSQLASLDITRWLQGDFNGDGRTDIGFFSKTDNNFWVGESTPSGFRYRIYNNLSYGPDTHRVMATPLPMDEVKIKVGNAVLSNTTGTSIVEYKYDGNFYADRGELVFPGFYIGPAGNNPEFLIYKHKENAFYFKQGNEEISGAPVLTNIDFNSKNIKVLNNYRAGKYRDNDAIFYYEKEGSIFSIGNYRFNLIYHNSSVFVKKTIANISGSNVTGFDPAGHIYLVDDFNRSSGIKKQVMVLDDKAGTPRFVLFEGDSEDDFEEVTIMDAGGIDFSSVKNNRAAFKLFSGRFSTVDSDYAQVLLVDRTAPVHKWYIGTITGSSSKSISFTALNGNPQFSAAGFIDFYRIVPTGPGVELVYADSGSGNVRFHKLIINGSSISQTDYDPLETGVTFKGEFTHDNHPVVYIQNVCMKVNLSTINPQLITLNNNVSDIYVYKINRNDLLTKIYPFRWIQGDYNGDGKTDIGIFRLKEAQWYFALTQGTVPDIIHRVRNGIGGTYEMEYINSTSLDNTGDDDTPDLPLNYRVCSKLTLEDGQGNRIFNTYEYSGGYAFSAFINGYKETDYFGFSTFKVVDALGAQNISGYYNVPYTDFRKNRALAGALKELKYIGSDHREYSKTEYEYEVYVVTSPPAPLLKGEGSYLVEPVKVSKYMKGVLTEVMNSNIVFKPGKYEMESKTESITDTYNDGVHVPVSVSSYSEFENIDSTNEMRLKIKRAFDGSSHETTATYDYDYRGNLTGERLSYTGSGLDAASDHVMEYEYDGYGNRKRTINFSSSPARVTETLYDTELHQFIIEERAIKESGYLSTQYTINYGPAFGALERKTDTNGNNTYFDYDSLGRLKAQRADTDRGTETFTEYSYNELFPLSVKVVQYTGTGDSIIETHVFTGGLGRVIHTVSSGLSLPGKRYTKSGLIKYDAVGRIISKSQTSWAADDEIDVFRLNHSEKNPTLTEYDGSSRVKKVTFPKAEGETLETSISYTYNDPWEATVTHSVGRSKRTVKNARGQVLYVEDSGRGDDSVYVNARIGFAYDLAGRRVKKMDLNSTSMNLSIEGSLLRVKGKDLSGNNVALWKYDGFGKLVSSSDPDLGYTEFHHNGFGEVISTTDALNRTTTMNYDMLGRLTSKQLPGSEGTVTYVYDSLTGISNGQGKLVAIDDPSQRKEFSYDRLGRVKRETREIKVESRRLRVSVEIFVTEFRYDLLGRKKRIYYPIDASAGQFPNGRQVIVTYHYSSMGVNRIETGRGSNNRDIVFNVDYNEFGQMTRIDRGNGTSSSYIYDIKGRLMNLATTTSINGSSRKLQDVTYSFKIDNSIKSTENRPDVDTAGTYSSNTRFEYTYDGLNRLVHATGSYDKDLGGQLIDKKYERSYSYAQNGNLTGKTIYDPVTHNVHDNWSYTYNNHAVTNIDTATHGTGRFRMIYDAAGNMVSQKDNGKNCVKEMTYDSSNRIVEVSDPDKTGDNLLGKYWYDDQGFRVRKIAQKDIDGEFKQIEVLYPSMYFGIEKQRNLEGFEIPETSYAVNNIYLNGVRIAAMLPDGNTRYYLTDQVDSVKVVVDDEGEAVTRFEYLPYGEEWFSENREGIDEEHNPKYNSQELDKESGYYFYNARHYDPVVGRFVTADTVVDGEYSAKGWNRYMYAGGNPVKYNDPTGHFVANGMGESSKGIDGPMHQGFWESALGSIYRGVDKGLNSVKAKVESDLSEAKTSNKSRLNIKSIGQRMRQLTLDHNQKIATSKSPIRGNLSKEIERGLKISPTLADKAATTSCVSASLYVDLLMKGINVEPKYGDFLSRNVKKGYIRASDGFINKANKNPIVSQYTKNGKISGMVRTESYDEYLKVINSGKVKHGVVRINDDHNLNVYKDGNESKVSDVGRSRYHGDSASEHIKRENFTAFEYIK